MSLGVSWSLVSNSVFWFLVSLGVAANPPFSLVSLGVCLTLSPAGRWAWYGSGPSHSDGRP